MHYLNHKKIKNRTMKNIKTAQTIILIIISVIINAQNYKKTSSELSRTIDSLQTVLTTSVKDTNSVKLNIELADLFQNSNLDSAMIFANTAFAIATNINWKKGISDCYLTIGMLFHYKSNYIKAVENYNNAIKIMEELGDKYKQAQCYNNMGAANCDLGNYNIAYNCYNKSLKIYRGFIKSSDTKIKKYAQEGISNCYGNMGNVYLYQGIYDKALFYYLKALKINEELGNKERISHSYNNIGIVHYDQGNFDLALEYLYKGLKLYQELNNKSGISSCYTNMGNVYADKGDIEKAMDCYNKSLKINEELNDLDGLSQCYINLGLINSENGSYNEALKYYLKAQKIVEEIGDQNGQTLVYVSIATLHILLADSVSKTITDKTNHLKESVVFGLKSFNLALEIKATPRQNEAAKTLMQAYKKLGNMNEAFKYSEIFIATKDSMFKEEKTKAMAGAEAKWQNEKKQQQIELQKTELSKQNIEIKRKKFQRNAFVIGFLLLFLLAIFILRSFLIKKKANRLLVEKNIEISQQKEEITTQAEQLETTNRELEKLSIVASKTDNSVVIADNKGNIEWVNAGFTKLFGFSFDEFTSTSRKNLYEASNNPDIKELINRCIQSRESVSYNVQNSTKNGNKIWVRTTLTPIIDSMGIFSKVVAIDSDITKLIETEEENRQQKEELQAQSELLVAANELLEHKNIQIIASIEYAKLIQEAILPSQQYFKSIFPNSFIFYKPKSIVSGDFFWLYENNNNIFFAVVDCTGHGVPGAFMSMIGNILLNEIIIDKAMDLPSQILAKLHEKIVTVLKQDKGLPESQNDGMDISLIKINTNENKLTIASANHSVLIFKTNNEPVVIDGNIYSIGGFFGTKKSDNFTDLYFNLNEISSVYLFTDGYFDQFGGEQDEKFRSDRLKKILKEIHMLPIDVQYESVNSAFLNWKGNNSQTDDITLIGIKF